jgi:nicotinamidase-related amidase
LARFVDLGPSFVPPVRLARDGSTALLIVDMQLTVTQADRGFGLAMETLQPGIGAQRQVRIEGLVVPTIRDLLAYFREEGLPVVFTVVGSRHRDYRDLPPRFRESHRQLERLSGIGDTLWLDGEAAAIRQELAPLPDEIVVEKRSFGAFSTSPIDQILRDRGVQSLVITGVGTSACVESTAREAADRDYGCVLVADGMASYSPEAHEATLRAFQVNFGRVVRSAADVIEAMSQDAEIS